jgi:hypothetical protein
MEITIKRGTGTTAVQPMPYPNLTIRNLLLPFRQVLKDDFVKYRNHVCRVFLNCMHLDRNAGNMEKYAIAAVFHDIGIWTAGTFDYIAPSVAELKAYLKARGKQAWEEELSLMICWHHKVSRYTGAYQATVDTFRKADLMDLSYGLLPFYGRKQLISGYRNLYPDAGFHFFLLKATLRNLLLYPLKPLPMYRW